MLPEHSGLPGTTHILWSAHARLGVAVRPDKRVVHSPWGRGCGRLWTTRTRLSTVRGHSCGEPWTTGPTCPFSPAKTLCTGVDTRKLTPISRSGRPTSTVDRQILGLAVPALGALIAEPLFVLIDSAIVGRLGTTELAGLSLASTLLVTAVGLCVFLAYATTAVVARKLGSGDRVGALQTGVDGLWLAAGPGPGPHHRSRARARSAPERRWPARPGRRRRIPTAS